MDWEPIILTLKLAGVTTGVLLVLGIPLAWWLAYARSWVKPVAETVVSLPLVLPPTVLGFYLLVAFSKDNALGAWLDQYFGIQLAFSFWGLVVGSVLYSLPFMVQPIQNGFAQQPPALREAAQVLGKSKLSILFRVLLPNMKPALITGIVLAFAHTLGEFGVVMMIGGSIPGKTRVASIAIYNEWQVFNYEAANEYALVLIGIAFVILLPVYLINGGYLKRWKN